jgi:Sensors of blue-light using FAD
MITLSHLIYSSAATQPFDDTEMAQLLRRARANNARLGITGMLLYENGSFFQVLEGNSEALARVYQNIARDTRHTKVVTIIQEPIAKRAFDEWTMGYSRVSPEELDEIVGLNDFFTHSTSFTQINSGRAKKLLAAFRDGRWRSKVAHTSLPNRQEAVVLAVHPATMQAPKVSFAFQPIIDVGTSTIKAYEAFTAVNTTNRSLPYCRKSVSLNGQLSTLTAAQLRSAWRQNWVWRATCISSSWPVT